MPEFNAHVRPIARVAKKYRYLRAASAPAYRPPAHPRRMHRLLYLQLQRKLGLADTAQLKAALIALAALSRRVQGEDPATARLLAGLGALLDDVAVAYAHHDLNIALLQRSLELTSEEWFAANERLRRELAARSRALDTLRIALAGLLHEDNGPRAANDADDIEQLAGELAQLTIERARAEEQLRLWRKVFEASREGIVITDANERIVSANSAVTEITGYGVADIIGQTPRLFSSGSHDAEFFRRMWETLAANGYWEGEIWDRRKNGEVYPKWLTISAVRNPQGEVTHYIAMFNDITERKSNEERIRHIAYHDALTGLPNRLLLRDRFEQEIAHARRVGTKVELLFLDLDHFKNINDSLGHPVGDKLLCAASARLKSCLRETDIISRQGGDEFVIVLSGRGADDNLPHIARKLLDRLNEPFEIDGHTLNASSSVGIGVFPDDGEDFDTLLQKADTALYRAKEDGRGTYRYFDRQMDKAAQERMTIESCLRGALERGELSLHYQPQVNLKNGGVVGVEALLRWTSPELGAVAPARFIPIAEDSGMILAIGAWVLREACRAARAWHDGGWPGLTVAVNLSAAQFRRGDLAKTLAAALHESGADPGCIELELTESVLIEADGTLAMVRRLKECGVRLAIDDFGTGYSSLAYLKRFAVDRLKIDRSFIAGLPDGGDDAAIVAAVIEMAHSLKLDVVAEGVETEAQAAFLRQAGCEQAQGFLYGKPEPQPLALAAEPAPRRHLRALGE